MRHRTSIPSTLLLLWLFSLFQWGAMLTAEAEQSAVPQGVARVIRLGTIFDASPDINVEDARLALEILTRNIMTSHTHPFLVRLDIITDLKNAHEKIISQQYDFVVLTGLDFLSLKRKLDITPLLVMSKVEQPTEELLLVTQQGQTFETLSKKETRTLILEAGRIGDIAKMWLDTELYARGLGTTDTFFTKIRLSQKNSRSVLPVFFNQVEACVVPRNALMVMQELNPQIENRVHAIAKSEGLVLLMLCSLPWSHPQDVAQILEEALNAERDPKARQALTIVQMKRFFRYEPAYMEATAAVFERSRQIPGRTGKPEAANTKAAGK